MVRVTAGAGCQENTGAEGNELDFEELSVLNGDEVKVG